MMQAGPIILTKCNVMVPARIAKLNVKVDLDNTNTGQLYEVQPNSFLMDKHIHVILLTAIHMVDSVQAEQVLFLCY